MTSMSSTGFGQYPGEPSPGGSYEQRTSVMAILSLVCSLICFIPGLAALGAIFGVASLVTISRSGDRLTGRGLAIAGLIISLIVLAGQAGILLGAGKVWAMFNKGMIQPSNQAMLDIEQGDFAKLRKTLTPEASKRISDEDLIAFRDQYQSELGHFKGLPTTFMGLLQDYSELAPIIQQFNSRNDTLPPLPATFDKGKAVLVFQLAPNSTGPNGTGMLFPPVVNIMIMAPSGSKWTLYDPQRAAGPPAAKPDKPSKPDSPKPDTATTPKEPEPKPGPG